MSSASTVAQSVLSPANASSNLTVNGSRTPDLAPSTSWTAAAPTFPMNQEMSATPVTPGPSGMAPLLPIPSNFKVPAAASPFPLAGPGSSVPAVLGASNPAFQPQISPYHSLTPVASSPHGVWFPQVSGISRPPYLPYPAAFPGPVPFPARGMTLPSVPLPDPQPPGVTPVRLPTIVPASSAPFNYQHPDSSGMQQTELTPPGTNNQKNVLEAGMSNNSCVNEQTDAWTAHRSESGVVYYYNALTGESTYEKPSGFKEELDKVSMQPNAVSVLNLSGTDWVSVTMSDGKKYYYNSKTKVSSWQMPSEVTELRKKQDEENTTLPNTNALTEKGSAPISLNTPAIHTGGRDALALRSSGTMGSSSALDLIKKKLADSGAPVTSPGSTPVVTTSDINSSKAVDTAVQGLQSDISKDKPKDANGDGDVSDSSSDSDDVDSGPTNEECIIQFKEMLKERGVAPFSKWEKELPKIVFDPRFKAIPSYSARRSLFEHYVKTRAEEERKEKRAAQKAAIEGFKQLLDEASKDIDENTDYQGFRKRWGSDSRFEALDRKDREHLLNERVISLRKAAEEKAQALRASAVSSFKSMLREREDINVNSRWSKVKDSLRDDPRYRSVKHEEREILFNEYISEIKAVEEEAEREMKAKRGEQEKLKEREREWRKRKEREEQEMERVRIKVRRKEAVSSFQALLMETIKDPQASWTESKSKLEKDPQGRAANPDLDTSDSERLFREHIKMLQERCAQEYRALLSEVLTPAATLEAEDGKTIFNSWSTAKRQLKPDPRYRKVPRKDREVLWSRFADDVLHKRKLAMERKGDKHDDRK